MSEEKNKVYLIKTGSDEFKITIPESWKVTFGPVSPGSKSYGGSDLALRIYETAEKQRAIFTNVQWFRDLSIPVLRKSVTKKAKSKSVSTDNTYQAEQEYEQSEEWVEQNA